MTTPDWGSMTYDEQRAFLGLPDVRVAVAFDRMATAVRIAGRALDRFAAELNARAGSGRAS